MSTVQQHTYFIWHAIRGYFDANLTPPVVQRKLLHKQNQRELQKRPPSIPVIPAFHRDQEPPYNQNHGSKRASKIHWISVQNVTCDATAQPDSKKSQGKTCRNDGKVWLQRDAKDSCLLPATCEFESKNAKAIRINFTVHIDPPIKPCRKILLPPYTKGPQMHCLSTATCWQVFWISLSFTSQLFGDAPPWPLQVES